MTARLSAEARFAANLVLMTAAQLRDLAAFCDGLPSGEGGKLAASLRDLARSREAAINPE